jgi:LGFP repeat
MTISEKYQALGGASGFLGVAVSSEVPNVDGVGRHQDFVGGTIYWHPELGASEVHGEILGRWAVLGKEASALGYPLTDGTSTQDGVGRFNHFQHGSIYWRASVGAHDVSGAIRERWAQLRWERGFLGFPVEDQRTETRGRETFEVSRFMGGRIERNQATGEVLTFHMATASSPNFFVPVVALRGRDDNGANGSVISVADIDQWLARANAVFRAAGVRFDWDQQILTFDSTNANKVTGESDPNWVAVRDALNQVAAQRRSVVILFRRGQIGGFSSWTYDFVAMSEFGGNPLPLAVLAHELGHYFGLSHTHGPMFTTENAASDYFLGRFADPAVFDGDSLIVHDTPPDPFIEGLKLETSRRAVLLADTPFALARDNPMSYWYSPNAQAFTHEQIQRIRTVLAERAHRIPLNVTEIEHPLRITVHPSPVPLNHPISVRVTATEIDTGAAVAGDVLIDNQVVAPTSMSFSYTFHSRRKLIPGSRPPEWEVVGYPVGVVRVRSLPDTPIDFGFPDL